MTFSDSENMDKSQPLNVSTRLDEVESYHDDYLKEFTSLSKIFITLSIALIGFTLSFIGPGLRERIDICWIIYAWLFLGLTMLLGFLLIYFSSKIFKAKADYLHENLMFDVAERFESSQKERDQIRKSGNEAYKKYERFRKWIGGLIAAQAVSIFLSLVFLAIFIYRNFIMKLPVT